jgi:hypothetical protein
MENARREIVSNQPNEQQQPTTGNEKQLQIIKQSDVPEQTIDSLLSFRCTVLDAYTTGSTNMLHRSVFSYYSQTTTATTIPAATNNNKQQLSLRYLYDYNSYMQQPKYHKVQCNT